MLKHRMIYVTYALMTVTVSARLMAWVRADAYGLSLSNLIAQAVIGAILIGFLFLVGIVCLGQGRRTILLVVMCVLVSWVAVELWFGTDDFTFSREVQERAFEEYGRPRWYPFRSHGLVYQAGQYAAHD